MIPNTPKNLPVEIDYGKIARKLSKAQYALGKLVGRQRIHHNPYLLIAPLTAKEAAVSSRIEGTQSTVSDVFLHEAGESTKYGDVVQVSNYRSAIYYLMDELKQKPLTINVIKKSYEILLQNTRGASRRGDFRTDQVWLGVEGDPIEKATYIPPKPELVNDYMNNLEKYIHTDEEDCLVQAALLHYQFEAVHPFNDGNGRIGRLLIPVLLHQKKQLSLPILYLSGYFEDNKDNYLDALHLVDTHGDYESWINYFLDAVAVQSEQTESLINEILELFNNLRKRTEASKSPYMSRLVDFIFSTPAFSTAQAVKELGADRGTILRLTKELIEKDIIHEVPSQNTKRKLYMFTDLLRKL